MGLHIRTMHPTVTARGRPPAARTAVGVLLGAVLLTLSCGREITGPGGGVAVTRAIALVAEFPQFPGQAAVRSGVAFERLRATLLRLDESVALDRTVEFPSTADSVALTLSATFGADATPEGEEMVLFLRFITAAGDTVFRSGPDTVFLEPARAGQSPAEVVVVPEYVGPGVEATRVVLSQTNVTVTGTAGTVFTAQAFDAQDAPVPLAPIVFSSSDTTLVRFANSRNGAAMTFARRDNALVFASLLTGPADTASVTVTLPASAIAAVSGSGQTGPAGGLLSAPVTVRVTASDAVGVEGVTVNFAAANGGSVGAASVITDAQGDASTTWTLGPGVGAQTMTATAAGLTGSPVTFTATATATGATQLEFTADPITAVAGATLSTVAVTALDAQGNPATSFTGDVTVAIGTNPGGGTLSGTLTVAAVAGVATFDNLSIERSGLGYTLVATADGLTDAIGSAFTVGPAAAAALAFVVQPSAVPVGTPITPPVVVEVRDAFGNPTAFPGNVTVAFGANPAGAVLGGTLVVPVVEGLAEFADLTVDVIGAGYTLVATADGLTDATSAAFNTVAELITWTNGSGGLWSEPSNWSLGRVPVATDSVAITLAGTYTVTLDTDFAGSFVTLGGASGTQTLVANGRTVTIAGQLTVLAAGVLSADGTTFTGGGTLVNAGAVNLRSVQIEVALENTGVLATNGSSAITGALATSAASVLRVQADGSTGYSDLTVSSGFFNQGLIELTSVGSAYTAALTVTAGTLTNEATGSILVSVGSGGPRALAAEVHNLGVIDVNQALTWQRTDASSFNAGTILADAAVSLVQSGTAPIFSNVGTLTIGPSGSFTVSGGGFAHTALGVDGSGPLTFSDVDLVLGSDLTLVSTPLSLLNSIVAGSGTLTNPAGLTMALRGTSIGVPLVNLGVMQLDGNNSIGGPYTTSAGSTLRLQGTGSTGFSTLETVGFTNAGAIELSSLGSAYSSTLRIVSGTLVNAPTGTITSAVADGGPRTLEGPVDNQGLIAIQQNLTWNAPNSVSVVSGTLDLVGGSLALNQSGSASFTLSGSAAIGAGRSFVITGGVVRQAGGAFTGTGALTFTNVTVEGPGALVNPVTRALTLRNTTIDAPFTNDGLLTVVSSSAINGSLTAPAGSTIRVAPDGSSGSATLTVSNGFVNAGAIELTSVGSTYSSTLAVPTGTLVNAVGATITSVVGSGGPRTLAAAVSNAGLIDINQPLTWQGVSATQVNDGTVQVDAATTVVQTGTAPSFENAGTLAIGPSGSFTVNGGTFLHDAIGVDGTGALVFTGATLDLATSLSIAGTPLTLVNTVVTGPGTLTNPAGMTLALRGTALNVPVVNLGLATLDGANSVSVPLTTGVGSTVRLQGSGSTGFSTLEAVGFTNLGTIELSSIGSTYASTLRIVSGTLVNDAVGTIAAVAGSGGPRTIEGSVDNQGQMSVQQPVTWTAANATILNSGTLDVVGGNLTINQSGTASFSTSGIVNIESARTLVFSGGTIAQDGGAFTGTGGLAVVNATVVGPGTFTNPATRTMLMRNSSASAPLSNQGILILDGAVGLNGTVTTAVGSTIRLEGSGSTGSANVTVATGFTNVGTIELTSVGSTYTASLTIVSGMLLNSPAGLITSAVGSGGPRNLVGSVDNQGTISILQPLTWTAVNATIANSGTLDMSGGNLALNQSGTTLFTLSGTATIGTGRAFTISGGTVHQDGGTFAGDGALNFTNVTVAGPGTLVNPASRSLTLRNSVIDAPFTNAGLLTVISSSTINGALSTVAGGTIRVSPDGSTGTATLTVSNGFTNNGAIEFTATGSTYNSGLSMPSGTLVNAAGGTITSVQGSGGGRTLSAAVDNQGTITLLHQMAWTAGNANNLVGGLLDISGGNLTLNQTGTSLFTVAGTVSIDAARSFTVNGGSLMQDGGSFTGTGALNFTDVTVVGPGTFINPATRALTLRSSTIDAPFTNAGLLTVVTPSTVNGALTAPAGSVIRIASDGSVGTSSLTVTDGFTNAGAIELSATASTYTSVLAVPNGTLVNAPGGTISALLGTGGVRTLNATVDNQGLISVQHPLTWNAVNVNNTLGGAVNVAGGNLTLAQSGTATATVTGTVTVGAGRAMTVNGGTIVQAGGVWAGTGSLVFNDVTVAGPTPFVNVAGLPLTLRNTTIDAPFTNEGFVGVVTPSVINGALTTVAGSIIRIATDGAVGTSTLTVANGFTNEGNIELTSVASTYTAVLAVSAGTLVNAPGGTIATLPGTGGARTIVAQVDNQGVLSIQQPTVWTAASIANQNNGTLDVTAANLTLNQTGTASFTTDGVINVGAGRILRVSGGTLEQTGGGFIGTGELDLQDVTIIGSDFQHAAGMSMRLRNSTIAANLSNEGLVWVATASAITGGLATQPGSTIRIASDGSVGSSTLTVAAGFTNFGTLELSALSSTYASTLDVGGGTLVNAPAGTISVLRATGGTRTLIANLDNQGLLAISPDGANVLNVTGNLTTSGAVAMSLGGLTVGSGYDRIAVTGAVTLGGQLDVTLFGAYVPVSLNTFDIITSTGAMTGSFAVANLASPLAPPVQYLGTVVRVGVP
jgi:hypothetical protein